jgi:hypothetical protein
VARRAVCRRGPAGPLLAHAATGFAGEAAPVEEVLRWGLVATAAAVVVWDYDACLSAATRGWHPRKVFEKLGITSRRGLRDALSGLEQEAASA